jgi:mycothiol synthase
MDDHTHQPQLQMVWPYRLLALPPAVQPPPGYAVRTYRRGDEPCFFQVMEQAGWPGWDYEKLQPRIAKIPPGAWFMAIHEESSRIVATAMAVHSHTEQHPFGAALGWVAGDPAHAGKGLGGLVCAAATRRLIEARCRNIHLYTEDRRLPALKTYLKVGYEPLLDLPEMPERWRAVCEQLRWPFTPGAWQRARTLGRAGETEDPWSH